MANNTRASAWRFPDLHRFGGLLVGLMMWMAATAASAGLLPVPGPDSDSDGAPDAVEVAEGTNPFARDNDIFGNTRLFVRQTYRDFVGREGDAAGITFWTNQINSGAVSRSQLVQAFLTSSEFQGTVAPVVRLYFAAFGRLPDYAGLAFWATEFKNGRSLASIADAFSVAPELTALFGPLNNHQYVERLYLNVLGRPGEVAGVNFWTSQLDSNTLTRGQVLAAFAESAEFIASSQNRVFVTMIYVGLLSRVPDAGGFTFWVAQFDGGRSPLELIQAFLDAPEFRGRFLDPGVNPVLNVLTVSLAGTATGSVSSDVGGINCGSSCSAAYAPTTNVTLTATATGGSTFAGWSGACTGTGTCTVSMSTARSVTATFTLSGTSFALSVSRAGTGSGTVDSNPSGISCGSACSASFAAGQTVNLTANASAGSTFTGWSGACSGAGACNVTMSAAQSVTATFAPTPPNSFALTVTKVGTGAGTVTSAPAGINCGATCVANFTAGTLVSLSAVADAGSTFAGWSGGGCSGTGSCVLTVSAAETVAATFTLTPANTFALTVAKAGNGGGVLSASAGGISCGSACTANIMAGSTVNISAAANVGSTFTGWSGACTGVGPCSVTMDAAKTVTATFTLNQYALTVARAGTGAGSINSAPAGINCGATCTANFDHGTLVTLTATPTAPAAFTGWSGACAGSGACVVTLTAAANVTASFAAPTLPTISGPDTTTFTVGAMSSGTFTVTGAPVPALTLSGCTLPGGLSFNATTGVISGTPAPATGGVVNGCTVTATNAAGSAMVNFSLTVRQAPVITSSTTWNLTTGSAGSLAMTATGFPAAAFTLGACPVPGVSLMSSVLSATVPFGQGGSYICTVNAANGVMPNASQTITVNVAEGANIAITSGATAVFTRNVMGTFTITTSAIPAVNNITLTGCTLPAGLMFSAGGASATISGTPTVNGNVTCTVTVSNGALSATQSLVVSVREAPTITSANAVNVLVGSTNTFAVTATGSPAPTFALTGCAPALPPSVTFSGTTLSWAAPTAGQAGNYACTLTASNGAAPNSVQNPFTIRVGQPPVASTDTYTATRGTTLNVNAATGLLANDGGLPTPTIDQVNITGLCTMLPCVTTINSHTVTVQGDGSLSVAAAAGGAVTPITGTYRATNVFGSSTGTLNINIQAAAPVLDLNGPAAGIDFAATFTEGGGTVAIVDPALTVGDTDSANLVSARAVIANLQNAPSEVLSVTCTAVAPGCEGSIQLADISYNAGTGTLDIVRAGGAPLADFQTLLRTLRYNNTSTNPGTVNRTINVTITDQTSMLTSNPVALATVTVVAVNTAPTIAAPTSVGTTPSSTFTFNAGNVMSVADVDAGTSTLTITLTATNGTINLSGTTGLTGVAGQGTATISATGTLTDLNAALNGLTFVTTAGFMGGSLQVQVNDNGNTGTGGAQTATRTITVNFAPTITITTVPAGLTIVVDGNTLTAPQTFNWVPGSNHTIATTTPQGSGGTRYVFNNWSDSGAIAHTVVTPGVNTTYTANFTTEYQLTLAVAPANGGTVTPASGQFFAAGSVQNVTATPNAGMGFLFDNWTGPVANSAAAATTVTMTGPISVTANFRQNTASVVTASGGATTYTENDPATVVDALITVADTDSANIIGATVVITGNCQNAQDVLSFATLGPISGTYTAATCSLALSGTDTVANYQAALRTVRYANTSDNPSTLARTVEFQVNDGGLVNNLSNTATKSVNVISVNDAPVLTPFVGPPTFTEGGPRVAVDGLINVNDVDNTTLASATITIDATNRHAADVLDVSLSVNTGNIAKSFTFPTLTLTSAGATATIAHWRTALRSVTFANTSQDPSTNVRSVTFQVNDGQAANNLSNTVTRNVNVVAVNTPPTATNPGTLAMPASIPITFPAGTLGGTDVEAGTTITIDTTPQAGSVPAGASVTINADGSFTFVPPVAATGTIVGFAYRVSDNGNPGPGVNSAYQNVSFNITGPNIYYVKATPAGVGNCTLANECTLATALTGIGATTAQTIFIGDSNTHSTTVTLNANGRLFGQAIAGGSFDAVFGVTAPGAGTIPARPLINQTRPTLSSAGATLTLAADNRVDGLNVSSTSLAGAALFGTNIGSPNISNVSVTAPWAISLSGSTAGTISLSSVTSTGGANFGVTLTNLNGVFTITNGSISGASGVGFSVNAGTADVSYGGTVNSAAGAARAVQVSNKAGGTVTFSGAVTDTGGAGILLNSNPLATINFTGGIAVSAGANTAFNAIGGGTINVTQNNTTIVNTLATTTGTALIVANTNIGASGITFRSVSSNGGANGIVLNNTGSSAGLTITGNGGTCTSAATCTGGAIQNATADAISLTGTQNATFTDMAIVNSGQSHINASTVTGLTLTRLFADNSSNHGVRGSSVTNLTIAGGTYDRGGILSTSCNINGLDFTNLLGTNSVTGATFRRSNTIQFRVNNTSATNFGGAADTLTVSATNWNTHNQLNAANNLCAGDHLSVNADTGANFSLGVNNSVGINRVNDGGTAATGGGSGVQATASGNGKMNATVTSLKTTANTAGVVLGNTGSGSLTFNVSGNKTANGTGFTGTGSLAIAMAHTGTGTMVGRIDDNSISHTAGPGTNALQTIVEGSGTGTVAITNNTISGNFQRAIQAQARLGTGTLNATITGNTLTGTDTTNGGLQIVNIETAGSGAGHGNTICLNLASNAAIVPGGGTYLAGYRLFSRGAANCTLAACSFRLQDFTGNGALAADVTNWVTVTKANTIVGTPPATAVTATQAFTASAGACPTPP